MSKKDSYLYHSTASDEIIMSGKQQSHWTSINPLAFVREKIREIAKLIIQNPLFDQFILSVIMINCTFMIMSDYDHVDHMNNLSPDGSIRNQIILGSEIYFTAIFTCEFVLKWAALNIYGPNSYFYDSWNWLDFLVVVTSLVALAPNIPSIKVLRTFRVLRPLKSLRSFPAVAEIVEVFVASILKMGDIFGLIMFSYLFFAVIGLQIFSGPYMHTRCRLTPFPVTLNFQNMVIDSNTTIEAFESYRCLNASNVDYPGQSPVYTKASSPWSTPHPECYWPVDINDQQLCTLSGNVVHVCQHGYDTNLPISQWRWCGSSYDALGNDRFGGNATMMDNYLAQNGYGWINFDNFGLSLLTVIQSASGDSWSSIQYEIFDCFGVLAGSIFFNVIILVCLFFLQQLIIAILEEMFSQKMKKKIEKANRHANLANKTLGFLRSQSKLDVFKEELSRKVNSQRISYSPSDKDKDKEAADIEANNNTTQIDDSIPIVAESSTGPRNPRPSMVRNNSLDSAGSSQSKNITQQQLSRSNSSEISDRSTVNNGTSGGRPLLGRQASVRSIANSETGRAVLQAVISFINKYDKPQKNAFRRGCRALAESFLFQQFFSLAILTNTALFAYDHYPMRESISDGFDAVSFILTLLFTAELLINVLGFGLVESFSTWFGCFDFAIVFISVLDIALSPIPALLSNTTRTKAMKKSSLTALRSFRLFRLLRFFKSPTLKEVVRKIMEVVTSMGNFLVLLLLFHVILALIGMQFFANHFRFDDQGMVITEINSDAWINAPDRPRSNFDNFSLAVAAIFQMVTIDNWSAIMFNAYRAFGPFATLFPLFVYLSGSVLLMNLFLAILIRNFSDDDEEDMSDSKSNSSKSNSNSNSPQSKLQSPVSLRPILTRFGSVLSVGSNKSSDETFLQDYCSKLYCCCCLSCVFESAFYISMEKGFEPYRKYLKNICGGESSKSTDGNVGAWVFEGFILVIILLSCILLIVDSPLADPNSNISSFLSAMDVSITVIFTSEMLLKMFAFGLYGAKDAYFADGWNILDCFVVAVSIFSVITVDDKSLQSLGSLRALRALRPLKLVNRLPGLRVIVQALFGAATEIMNIAILVFFVFFIFAIFFTSFLKGQLRSCGGDVFDHVISSNSSYMDLMTYPVPWNSMTPWQQNWFGVSSPFLNASSPYSISTIYVNSTSELDCSSAGNCCPNWNFLDVDAEPPTSRQICECWGGGWYPVTDWRYDNVAQSLMTLFDDGTVDNWTDNMHYVSDSNGVDMQPIRDNQIYWIYVYCAFTLIGNYFCLQLFIGSITANFEKSRRKLGGLTGMTKAQQEWVLTRKIMTAIKPKLRSVRPKSLFFGALYDVTMHWMFESFITAIIILQCVVLSMTYFGQDDMYGDTIDALEITMTTIFAVEMVMKVISLTYKVYFQDVWNRIDFVIVICSVAVLLNSVITGAGNQAVVNVVRVLRIVRLLRVLKSLESLQILLDTVAFTIPGVINVSLLVLLTVYIFSVVCVQLFAKVAYNNSYYEDANFRTFGIAFTVLYRFLTGDNWGQFVVDLSQNSPGCVVNPSYNASYCGFNDQPGCIPLNGCGSIVAYPVLVIFMLFTTLVLLSVFISIIISNYSAVKESPIKTTEFSLFAEHWSQFDPHATRYIPYSLLFPLVSTMFQPFGFSGNACSRRQYGKRVGSVKVSKDGKVFFDDVLAALSKAHFERNAKWAAGEVFEFKEKKSRSLIQLNTRRFSDAALSTLGRLSPKRNLQRKASVFISSDSPLDSEEFTVAHYLAVDLISEAWERRKQSRLTSVSIGSHFYSRNLHALSENEELRNNITQFIKLKEEKASSKKSLSKRISSKLKKGISSKGSNNSATPDSREDSLYDLSKSISSGSLKLQEMIKMSSIHGQEERVSYTDDRVAPSAAVSSRFNFPIDETVVVVLSEERFSPVTNDDTTDSSIVEEKAEEGNLNIDDYRPFQQQLNMDEEATTPLPNHPTYLRFSPPSDCYKDSADSATAKRRSAMARRYVNIDSLLGNMNELGLYTSPSADCRRVSSPSALGGGGGGATDNYMGTTSPSELKHANLLAPIFALDDLVISSGRSKSLTFDGRRLADNCNSSPDRASYYPSSPGAEYFASPESFIASIDKYYEAATGEPFQSGSSAVTYRVNPQQIDNNTNTNTNNAAVTPQPPHIPLLTPPSYSATPKGDKIREISALFEKSKSSSPPWHTPSSQSLSFDLEGGMDTHTGPQSDREFQSDDTSSAVATATAIGASSRSKASQDRVKKLAALFEIDSALLSLSSSSSSSIVIPKK